jgi:uncharacterized membrane protein
MSHAKLLAQQSVPEKNERTMAALTHVSSIFFPIVGPLVSYLIHRRTSRFVRFHALSALFDELILKAALFVGGAVSLTITIVRITQHVQENGMSFSWDVVWPILLKMGITWALLAIIGVIVTIQSILQALRASKGEWKAGPLSGRMAAKWMGLQSA